MVCLFMLERAMKEGQEVLLSVAARERASNSKDMHRTRTVHGNRCLLCGIGRSMSGGSGGREARRGARRHVPECSCRPLNPTTPLSTHSQQCSPTGFSKDERACVRDVWAGSVSLGHEKRGIATRQRLSAISQLNASLHFRWMPLTLTHHTIRYHRSSCGNSASTFLAAS